MRILIREAEDKTYSAHEVVSTCYDPEDKTLVFDISASADDDNRYVAIAVNADDAEYIVHTLAKDGYYDITAYDAYLNEFPPEEEDASEPNHRSSIFNN